MREAEAASGTTAGLAEASFPPGAARPPFPIAVGPEQAVAHLAWREARDQVLAAVRAGSRLILVLGPSGTGKTLLLQEIARTLRADGADVVLQPRGDLPITAGTQMDGATWRRRVVLIDEAHRIDKAALEHLRGLRECAFVLARLINAGDGQTLPDGGEPSAAVTAVVVRLAALPSSEVAAFVAARLGQAGLSADLLAGDAIARLAERSGGVPRVLNMITGAALFLARAERVSRVEVAHVDRAAVLPPSLLELAQIVPDTAPPHQEKVELPPPPQPAAVASPDGPSLDTGVAPPSPALLGDKRLARRRTAAALCAGMVIGSCGAWLLLWQGEQRRSNWRVALQPAMMAADDDAGVSVKRETPPAVPEPELAEVAAAPPPEAPLPRPSEPGTAARPELTEVAAAPPPVPLAPPPEVLLLPPSEPVAAAVAAVPPPPARPAPAEAAAASPSLGLGALPSSAPAHVVVRYARGAAATGSNGSAAAALAAVNLATTLRIAGFTVDDPVAGIPRRDGKPGTRYFFAEDRDAAEAVHRAARLPGNTRQAETDGLPAPPRPGLIELIMPSPGKIEAGGGGRRESSGGGGRSS